MRESARRRTWMGRMAESSAERRLSKEPRMETTASVTCWLLCRDSRSSAARCARLSISADGGATSPERAGGWVVGRRARLPRAESGRNRFRWEEEEEGRGGGGGSGRGGEEEEQFARRIG